MTAYTSANIASGGNDYNYKYIYDYNCHGANRSRALFCCFRYSTFSHSGTLPACDRQTDGHMTAYTALGGNNNYKYMRL